MNQTDQDKENNHNVDIEDTATDLAEEIETDFDDPIDDEPEFDDRPPAEGAGTDQPIAPQQAPEDRGSSPRPADDRRDQRDQRDQRARDDRSRNDRGRDDRGRNDRGGRNQGDFRRGNGGNQSGQRNDPQRNDQRRNEQRHDQQRHDQPRHDAERGDEDRNDESRQDQRQGHRPGGGGRHEHRPAIRKQILANTTPDETRVAIIENDHLAEFFIDRHIGGADKVVGNIYQGRVENVLPGISSAFIDVGQEKNAYLYISDVISDGREKDIGKILKKGSTILVQVAKEAIGTKGMKVTMDISLPGRYLILMPMSEHVGVSRQVEDPQERDRLKRIVESLSPPGGVIIRTEAEGADERALRREMKYLARLWETIKKRSEKVQKGLIHKELGLTFQVVRDILSEDVDVFLLDSKQEFDDVKGFVDMLAPELSDRVRLYEARTPIFQSFNVEQEVLKLRGSRVDLPSGGYIIIQEAESLCAIDVNTGKFTGRSSQEETVTATNIEAAAEVARQLRLRNIGGIIVIDFIDMRKRRNRDKVMEAIARATRIDHAKIKILPITRLGLVEMTRERRRESLQSMTGEQCAECHGSGWVLSRDSLFLKIRKEIIEMTQGRTEGRLKIHLKGPVAAYFRENKDRLEKQVNRSVDIQDDDTLPWENYKIVIE